MFVLAVALVPLSGMPRAGAATLTVDSTADLPDTDLGDGVCSTAEASCTLRAAVEQAEALGGAHTIVVPAGIYALAAPVVVDRLDSDLTVVGAPGEADQVVLTGAGGRHLTVSAGSVTLTAVRLTGGVGHNHGGAVSVTGTGSVRLEQVQVDGNEATAFGGAASVMEDGSLVIVESVLSGNEAGDRGGAIWTRDAGAVTLVDTVVEGNEAADAGGGLDLAEGVVRVEGGRVSGNVAGNRTGGINAVDTDLEVVGTVIADNRGVGTLDGGGIHVDALFGSFRLVLDSVAVTGNDGAGLRAYGPGSDSSVLVSNSTIADNTGPGILTNAPAGTVNVERTRSTGNMVGGVIAGAELVDASLFDGNRDVGLYLLGSGTVRNTTISGNRGDGSYFGGGLSGGVVTSSGAKGEIQVFEHVTITDNAVERPHPDAGFHPPGGLLVYGGSTELYSTIVAANEGPECVVEHASEPGRLVVDATNLFSDGSCGAEDSDIVTTAPMLGALGSAAGPVPGHLPALESPAVDSAGDHTCPASDQVGRTRPQVVTAGGCDIGAVEVPAPPTQDPPDTEDDPDQEPDPDPDPDPVDDPGPDSDLDPDADGGPGPDSSPTSVRGATTPVGRVPASSPTPPAVPVRATARYTG